MCWHLSNKCTLPVVVVENTYQQSSMCCVMLSYNIYEWVCAYGYSVYWLYY